MIVPVATHGRNDSRPYPHLQPPYTDRSSGGLADRTRPCIQSRRVRLTGYSNMAAKKTPAEVVIDTFGVRPLAAELNCSPTTILRWRESEGGLVPSRWHQRLIKLAKAQGHNITPEILVNGR